MWKLRKIDRIRLSRVNGVIDMCLMLVGGVSFIMVVMVMDRIRMVSIFGVIVLMIELCRMYSSC